MSSRPRFILNFVLATFTGLVLAGIVAIVAIVMVLNKFGQDLPDYRQLADYAPPVVTRIHAGDGTLLKEYARQKRLFIPISAIPTPVIQAFLAAEDKSFYSHDGVDYRGVMRAMLMNVRNMVTNRRLVGASTITQQVAKNFLLTNVVSYERKIKEAILAYRIERAFSKDEILELYLNEIYLGYGSYGVAAAAINYFNKSLDELTLEEIAYLAALPKAPNNYHPIRRTAAATARRDWVLNRMAAVGFITDEEAAAAQKNPLMTYEREQIKIFHADYFAEEVRRQLMDSYGTKMLYEGGLSVRTTLSPRLQSIAELTLRAGLMEYDRRHGWRGPVTKLESWDNWQQQLKDLDIPLGVQNWTLAVVLQVNDEDVEIGFGDDKYGLIPLSELKWARQTLPEQKLGAAIERPSQVLTAGDIVIVELLDKQPAPAAEAKETEVETAEPSAAPAMLYGLRQIPEVEGAIVAMDPHTGRVLAMSGGFNYEASEFNRAVQAKRQPGSAFKPFVYAAALDSGFTPSSLILDAPFVIDQGYGMGKWKPSNYSDKFYGPSTLRLGLERSRNLMTVRLAQYIGMEKITDYADRFGITEDMPPILSMSLGAGETTLLQLTTAYSMLVNGGKRIVPSLIDRIQDRRGQTVMRHDQRDCDNCRVEDWAFQAEPMLLDNRERVLDEVTAYQIVSMLQGVIERGTGVRIASVGKPLAGKTGTTNDSADTWFVGFSPDLAVGVFVGFDTPRSLGNKETGSSVSAPIFRDFMQQALAKQKAIPFRVPEGVRLVRVNPKTGESARPGERGTILEAFRKGTEPSGKGMVLDGSDSLVDTKTGLRTGTGGLY